MKHLPAPQPDWALFLDVDGTLVEIANHPDAARPAPQLGPILQNLAAALNGAVAVVSGRSIAGLDALLGTTGLATAGLHGLERRAADGRWHERIQPTPALDAARTELKQFAAEWPGTYLEDKGAALALHYRQAPEAADPARERLDGIMDTLAQTHTLIPGKAVFELRPRGADKGKVVERFLDEVPFAGRTPVFIGDDVTDEDGFDAANRLGGISIRVGELEQGASRAQYKLNSVQETLQWLQEVAAALAGQPGKPT